MKDINAVKLVTVRLTPVLSNVNEILSWVSNSDFVCLKKEIIIKMSFITLPMKKIEI